MELSSEERLRQRVEHYNSKTGDLTGYDCPKCLNKGHSFAVVNGYETYITCECMEIRRNVRLINESGLKDMMEENTFSSYKAVEPWQKYVLETAKAYAEDPQGLWFVICGQSGAGKTHLCTAIVGSLLQKGIETKYCLWIDESKHLKSIANDPEYAKEIAVYKKVPCLYIDDLFKTKDGVPVTGPDVTLAFEIINYRRNNKLITIISSEKTSQELIAIDQATGGRIVQMAQNYLIDIAPDQKKNYRLK